MHVHAHPDHAPASPASPQGRLLWMLLLTGGFMGVEAVGGWVSGSLALLADAGHMLTDFLALGLAAGAAWLSGRETTARRTYGFRRAEILAAFCNALALLGLAAWITVEAIGRLQSPRPVLDGVMLAVAVVGLLVNVVGLALLHGPARTSLNVRAALWHVLGDLLGSVGVLTAALVIRFTGWLPMDPLVGLLSAALICVGAGRILLESTNMLLDTVPKAIDTGDVEAFLRGYDGVERICDLHIWGISSSETMLSAHLVVAPEVERDPFLHALLADLNARFPLAHMTVQLESTPHDTCPPEW